MAIVKININAIKFEDMTVTFHPIKPSRPVIINTEKKQLLKGTMIQINFLNKTYEVVYLGNKVTKVYGYKILDSEISKLITLIVRANMEAIKSIYKDE